MTRIVAYTFHSGGIRTEPEQCHHCPQDITWHVGRVGSGHFHLLLYSAYQMILIIYVHVRPWPIWSKLIANQDNDCCINSVASPFLLLLLFQPYFHLLQVVKLNKVILKLKTKCSHVNKDKEKLLRFPYGLLHLKDAMRELTKIDGHESVESSMCELKKSNLMKLYVLMDQRQFADIAHFMDRNTLAYLCFSDSHSCPITGKDTFSHGPHSAKPMLPESSVFCKPTLKWF